MRTLLASGAQGPLPLWALLADSLDGRNISAVQDRKQQDFNEKFIGMKYSGKTWQHFMYQSYIFPKLVLNILISEQSFPTLGQPAIS